MVTTASFETWATTPSAKAVAAGLIFFDSMLGGLLALGAQRYNRAGRSTQVVSLLNCACGGILFSAGMLHLLPEAEDKLARWNGLDLSHFFASFGFLVAFLVEKIRADRIQSAR